MPWLRGEATGRPGLRTANLQRDHRLRLESSFFRAREDVNWPPFQDVPVYKTLDDLKRLKEEIMPQVEVT